MFACDSGSDAVQACRRLFVESFAGISSVGRSEPVQQCSRFFQLDAKPADSGALLADSPPLFSEGLMDALVLDQTRSQRARANPSHSSNFHMLAASQELARLQAKGTKTVAFAPGTAGFEFEPRSEYALARRKRDNEAGKRRRFRPIPSLLTEQLREYQDANGVGETRQKFERTGNVPQLRVFYGHALKKRMSTRLNVAPSTTVHDVIAFALDRCFEHRTDDIALSRPVWGSDPSAWNLHMAEDDGKPDSDMPPLNRDQLIVDFKGCSVFVILPKPRSEEATRAEDQPPRVLRISLPHASSTVSLIYDPTMSLRDIHDAIVGKGHSLPRQPVGFQIIGETEFLPWNASKTLTELPENALLQLVHIGGAADDVEVAHNSWAQLRSKDRVRNLSRASAPATKRRSSSLSLPLSRLSRSHGRQSSVGSRSPRGKRIVDSKITDTAAASGSPFHSKKGAVRQQEAVQLIFNPTTATVNQNYAVVKISKMGTRTEHIMSIGAAGFMLQSRRSSASGPVMGANADDPGPGESATPIANFQQAECDPNSNKQFVLKWTSGKTDTFECTRAMEIVGKINYLKMMET